MTLDIWIPVIVEWFIGELNTITASYLGTVHMICVLVARAEFPRLKMCRGRLCRVPELLLLLLLHLDEIGLVLLVIYEV